MNNNKSIFKCSLLYDIIFVENKNTHEKGMIQVNEALKLKVATKYFKNADK